MRSRRYHEQGVKKWEVSFYCFCLRHLRFSCWDVLLKKRDRLCRATGNIVDISTLAAETMKVYNSKWALVMYNVDGQMIISQNRIVVPMSSNIGDPVKIQYDRDNPSVLIVQSPKRFVVFMLCAAAALIIALFLKT